MNRTHFASFFAAGTLLLGSTVLSASAADAVSRERVRTFHSVSASADGMPSVALDAQAPQPGLGTGTSQIPSADFNDDGQVDFDDFLVILFNWGLGGDSGADLNGDGIVDGIDLGLVLALMNSVATDGRVAQEREWAPIGDDASAQSDPSSSAD